MADITIDERAFGLIQQELGVLQSNSLILSSKVERLGADLKSAHEMIDALKARIQSDQETIKGLRGELEVHKPAVKRK
jgi:peptidoglycan hydrolase CwlO-like protein